MLYNTIGLQHVQDVSAHGSKCPLHGMARTINVLVDGCTFVGNGKYETIASYSWNGFVRRSAR
jgi:hypothetical protein